MDARRADALTDVCAHILAHGIAPTGALPGGTPLKTEQGRRPHLHVVAAATTLLGLDEVPGELTGYGPIPAAMVRAIAADATWRRIFTDPATGHLSGIGPRGYRPGADLTGTVLARDTTCTFFGCRIPAWRCDLDHRTPFDHTRTDRPTNDHRTNDHDHGEHGAGEHGAGEDGAGEDGDPQTCAANLHCLCRHHHRLKTYTGWTVVSDPRTGDTTWTAPTGHRYTRPATDFNPDPPPRQPRQPLDQPDDDADPPF